jgi:hypothetical protein
MEEVTPKMRRRNAENAFPRLHDDIKEICPFSDWFLVFGFQCRE